MKKLTPFLLLLTALFFTACGNNEKAATNENWHPQDASVARHITSVHGFTISGEEGSHLRVEKVDKTITATFRDDVLADLGGEKALFILGWEQNPQEISRAEYLYFLEALHAYLVLNAPKWDGGEGASSAPKMTATE